MARTESSNWWSAGQRWLEQEAAKEAASQKRVWIKSGRSAKTFRYNPPEWHRDAVDALGRNDEETFKAIKLGQLGTRGLPPLSKRRHATMKVKIPDSGYVIAPHGGDYVQAFRTGRGALGDSDALKKARHAAGALAEKSRVAVDIVRVGARGQDRYLVEEVYPREWGQTPYRAGGARHHATKKKSPAQLDREIAEVLAKKPGGGGPRILKISPGKTFAGQRSITAEVQYPGEPPSRVEFVGPSASIGGPGPVVMISRPSGHQTFVTDPSRFGNFGPEWVRRFFESA